MVKAIDFYPANPRVQRFLLVSIRVTGGIKKGKGHLAKTAPMHQRSPIIHVGVTQPSLSINLFASDHMDPYHNKRKYKEMIE